MEGESDVALWLDFHTAFETMAGVNVALFTFRELRQPGLEREGRQWQGLVDSVPIGTDLRRRVHETQNQFELTRREIESDSTTARNWCAVVAAMCVFTLGWATYRAQSDAYAPVAWLVLAISTTPAIIFVGHNARIKGIVDSFSTKRRQFEEAKVR